MTEKISKDDRDWLDVLSGKSPVGVDPFVAAQALAVRKAMVSRREAIESDADSIGNRGLDEIRARLQREGLMDSVKKNGQLENGWWRRTMDIIGLGSSEGGTKMAPVWGVAAMLVAAVLVTFQVYEPQPDEALIYRGDPHTTTLIVENPEIRANEIIAGVRAITSDSVEMKRLKDGSIQLKIKDSQRVQDYLLALRIEAMAFEGVIRIDVVPKKK